MWDIGPSCRPPGWVELVGRVWGPNMERKGLPGGKGYVVLRQAMGCKGGISSVSLVSLAWREGAKGEMEGVQDMCSPVGVGGAQGKRSSSKHRVVELVVRV